MRRRSLVALASLLYCSSLTAQSGSAPAMGWFNGDCRSGIPGQANWYLSTQLSSRTFDDFVVPAGGLTISGVFSINSTAASVTEAVWEIRSGISAGNGGTIVASGRSAAAKKTLLATWPDGETIYRIEVDGLAVHLPAGTYWLNVSPVVSEWSPTETAAPSYVCATVGDNAVGNPRGTDGNAYFVSTVVAGAYFRTVQNTGGAGTSGDFSHGLMISSTLATPAHITAVVNAANWQSGAVCPGEIVTIAGTNLGPPTPSSLMLDDSGRVFTALNGVRVLFNNIEAPQTYVSSGQINAVVPYEIAGITAASIQVQVAGQASAGFPITVAAGAPAVFTVDGSGSGPAAALNQDGSYNTPSRPAAKGSVIVLYLTGEGLTNPAVTGKVTVASTTAPYTAQPVLSPVTASVAGQPAAVIFAGEAPGMVAGVLQLNLQIPSNTPSGNVPVTISLGTFSSSSGVTVAVQ
jgi:uncharacterized protein (TIGR03437 family)